MDVRRIVVVVEDVEAARTALKWALQNLIRFGDFITLLHVFPSSRSKNKNKTRLLRLKGFRLALSFKDICDSFPNTKVEMVVTEGDDEGKKIAAMVREIGASELVLGLHDHSFLYKLAMAQGSNIANNFMNCRVLAIKQPPSSPLKINKGSAPTAATPVLDSSTNLDFSQIDVAGLQIPDVPPPKIPYKICPNPYAIIWKSRRGRRRNSRK
ncbi:PREDICTED: uncharacterized protein LOC101313612 [Fragaria vesca subsp. vesca]|uniref:uncharacterized protein LOC101313612 n=1 Tax=Fragaria vesca subsp. vesca TaxID=101020 RepID=UPI0002C3109D|nr:PREDICTED: uncharacterized protein LOC101313612 [Fragaria vesca subsp. vesca]